MGTQQENVGESRNEHFSDAAARSRVDRALEDSGYDAEAGEQDWMNEIRSSRTSSGHNPWKGDRTD